MMCQTSVVDNEAAILRSLTLMEKVVEHLNLNVVYVKPSKLRKEEVYAPTMPAHVVVDSLMIAFNMDMNLAAESVSGVIKYTTKSGDKMEVKFSSEYDKPIYGDMGIIGMAVLKGDTIEAFMLSCRAFDRGFECLLLDAIKAEFRGILKGVYRENGKNDRFQSFYAQNGVVTV